MKTSTEIGGAVRYIGYERAVEAVAKAGFNAFDLSLISLISYNYEKGLGTVNEDNPFNKSDYVKFAKRIKQIGLDNGIVCNQSHSPFPVKNHLAKERLKKCIEITAEAGGEYCIIHPNNELNAEENAEMYFWLLPFAKEHKVKIATENMWGWDKEKERAFPMACGTPENFNAHLDAVNDEYLVACLDIGHAEMLGEKVNAADFVRALNKRLKCLHIHDNDKWRDLHLEPFTGKIDFVPIAKALKDIDYQGYFTLECDAYVIEHGKGGEENVYKTLRSLNRSINKFIEIYKEI